MTNRHAQSAILRAIVLAVVLIPAKQRSALPQQLDATERAIVSYVDAHIDEAIALLERVVNINSGTMNLEGVAAVGHRFRMELDALGFATEWIDTSPSRTPFATATRIVPPTATTVVRPTATRVIRPTATRVIRPTATRVIRPTATRTSNQ